MSKRFTLLFVLMLFGVCGLVIHQIRSEELNRLLFNAASDGNVHDVQLLLRKGADPSYPEEGLTPLMVAASGEHLAVIEILIEAGADPGWSNDEGHNAAWYAPEGSKAKKYLADNLRQ